jgi:hypothetical protein
MNFWLDIRKNVEGFEIDEREDFNGIYHDFII